MSAESNLSSGAVETDPVGPGESSAIIRSLDGRTLIAAFVRDPDGAVRLLLDGSRPRTQHLLDEDEVFVQLHVPSADGPHDERFIGRLVIEESGLEALASALRDAYGFAYEPGPGAVAVRFEPTELRTVHQPRSTPLVDARTGMEMLDERQCWSYLEQSALGRIVIGTDGLPDILPVAFVVDRGRIAFRSAAGRKMAALVREPVAVFEVDDYDVDLRTGWSVLVRGRGRLVTDPEEIDQLEGLTFQRWADHGVDQWVVIEPWKVTGRRLVRPAAEAGS